MKKSKLILGTLSAISLLLSTNTVSASGIFDLKKIFMLATDDAIPSLSQMNMPGMDPGANATSFNYGDSVYINAFLNMAFDWEASVTEA
jgi:hypothetical protein